MSRRRLPGGITALGNGRYRVQVQTAVGANKRITRTYDTVDEAVTAWRAGHEAKAAGADVAASMDGANGRPGPGEATAQPPTRPSQRRDHAPLLRDAMRGYVAERERLVEISDPTHRRSISKGRNTYRKTSLRTLRRDETKFIAPCIGGVRTDELSRKVIHDWLETLAAGDEALGLKPQKLTASSRALITVRAVIKQLPRRQQPDDFPWVGLAAIKPSTTQRRESNPLVWGGKPGDPDPLLPFSDMLKLAAVMHPADRAVVYIGYLAGLRLGESMGLRLRQISLGTDSNGKERMRFHLGSQMLDNGEIVDWLKSDASYRTVTAPDMLARYVKAYALSYHQYDFARPRVDLADRPLVVNPAGRDLDGTRLPGRKLQWAGRLIESRGRCDLDYAKLGYDLTSHNFRKTLATYLLLAEELSSQIPGGGARLGFAPLNVSAYLGHEHSGDREKLPASPVTISHYLLGATSTLATDAIADYIDRLARHEQATIEYTPADDDLYPVHAPQDPEWLTVAQAVPVLGIDKSNVVAAIHRGELDGHLGWLADGGWRRNNGYDDRRPAVPMYFISRSSLQDGVELRRRMSLKAAGRQLGMAADTLHANFIATGRLSLSRDRLDSGDVARLHEELLDALAFCIPHDRAIRSRDLKARFDAEHGHLLGAGRATLTWVERWAADLASSGRVRLTRDGRNLLCSINPTRDLATLA